MPARAVASGRASVQATPPPQVLFVPDASPALLGPPSVVRLAQDARDSCPPAMVSVVGQFCIDQFEISLVDVAQGRDISPYYHPTRGLTRSNYESWQSLRFKMGPAKYQLFPVPEPPSFQLTEQFDVKAVSRPRVVPQGYLSGLMAERACKNAGKRLCTEQEWVTACRGEQRRKFPYGSSYMPGQCNVFAKEHPARVLHGKAGLGHLDPRLNHFSYQGRPMLHDTGENPRCASRWGKHAAYDMVGNLDEWIQDERGAFLGGFYARHTRQGCEAKITSHPRQYLDYSLGTRCCL